MRETLMAAIAAGLLALTGCELNLAGGDNAIDKSETTTITGPDTNGLYAVEESK